MVTFVDFLDINVHTKFVSLKSSFKKSFCGKGQKVVPNLNRTLKHFKAMRDVSKDCCLKKALKFVDNIECHGTFEIHFPIYERTFLRFVHKIVFSFHFKRLFTDSYYRKQGCKYISILGNNLARSVKDSKENALSCKILQDSYKILARS